MKYKIIIDSCGEIPGEYRDDERFASIPLGLEVGDYCILDDEDFDQAEFLQKVAEYPNCPRSSCPSPERYMDAYDTDASHIYVITLSSKLSGSHNSACLAKSLYLEKHGEHKCRIHVIDSLSASCGETQIALKLMELEEEGLSFEEIVERIERFRDGMCTYFVLDNLETLRKNGRLSGVKSVMASTLNIKPVMAAEEGIIVQKGQCVGIKKALGRLAEMAAAVPDGEKKRLMITHCNAPERAELIKKLATAKHGFRECIIMDMRGVSSMYANDGGVIVTV